MPDGLLKPVLEQGFDCSYRFVWKTRDIDIQRVSWKSVFNFRQTQAIQVKRWTSCSKLLATAFATEVFPEPLCPVRSKAETKEYTFNLALAKIETTHRHLMTSCRHESIVCSERTLRIVSECHSCRSMMALNFYDKIFKRDLHDHVDARQSRRQSLLEHRPCRFSRNGNSYNPF